MTQAAAALLADALRMDEDARAEIAAELLASLDGPADANAEAEWDAEISRRVASIESGTAVLEPWDDVRRRIERDVLGRGRTEEPPPADLADFDRAPLGP
jgi:hypothetical protein